MSSKKTKPELTWSGNEHRPRLESRILLEDKLACQKQIRPLESLRNDKLRSLFDALEPGLHQRFRLIKEIEEKPLSTSLESAPRFTIGGSLS